MTIYLAPHVVEQFAKINVALKTAEKTLAGVIPPILLSSTK
jgi:hypothetical protein